MKRPVLYFVILLLILGLFFYGKKLTSADNYKGKVFAFTSYENSRDLGGIINYFAYPISNYWGKKKVGKAEITLLYEKNWERTAQSENFIQDIVKINSKEYILHTVFKYKYKNSNTNRLQLSKVKFLFDAKGKIQSISNVSHSKIDYKIFVELKKQNKFSYQEHPVFMYKIILGVLFLLLLFITLFRKQIIGKKNLEEEKRQKEEIELKRLLLLEENKKYEEKKKEEEKRKKKEFELNRLFLLEEQKKHEERKKRDEINRIARGKRLKEKRELEKRIEEKIEEERKRIDIEKSLLDKRSDIKYENNNKNDDGDTFFQNHLSSYMKEFDDDDNDPDGETHDIAEMIVEKFMNQELKNKLKNK